MCYFYAKIIKFVKILTLENACFFFFLKGWGAKIFGGDGPMPTHGTTGNGLEDF